jgi:hypothetical protein
MTSLAERNTGRKVALFITGLNVAFAVAALVVYAIELPPVFFPEGVPWVLAAIINSLLAFLILSRHPGHIIGWLFVLVSFLMSFLILGNTLEADGPQTGVEVVDVLISILFELTWIIALFAPITLVLQYFPDGRLPSPRWWPVPVATVLAMVLTAASFIPDIVGPLENEIFFQLIEFVATIFMLTAIFGSVAAVVVRYRRSQGVERLQMKWPVFTAVVGILLMLLLALVAGDESPIIAFYTTSLPTLLALSVGAAILRYRLYDIDIIIRRTLQYGIVTGILALVYFGLVVVFQSFFTAVGEQQSGFFIVASTLVIAALFNPVRKRVQHAVDRRFYRQKYQAEQILADFAAVARDEVDLDQIAAALMDVIEETMKPERASLSLLNKDKEAAS